MKGIRRPKKGKVFASLSSMTRIIEEVNAVQEERTARLLEKDASLLKYLAQKEASKAERKEKKAAKIAKIKQSFNNSKIDAEERRSKRAPIEHQKRKDKPKGDNQRKKKKSVSFK